MKILRIKLVNFIGIMHGMGTDEIEIDFTKGKNKIVMFRGKNGSGKSTIVGSLTPFKQSTDNREQLILDGKDGRKEIDYEHKGHIYKIIHTYPAKGSSQSFISKDGIELNENGGVKTCEDIILKEFGITKDYFKIGKIGSNTKNFVDFTTADRKKYIGTFLDISDMLEKYKIVNDKLKALKKDVLSIGAELKTYESKDVLETKIKQLEKDISECDAELNEKLPIKGSLEERINNISDIMKETDVSTLLTKKAEKEKDISDNKKIKDTFKNIINISDIATAKENLQKEISTLQGDIRVNDNERTNKDALKFDYASKIAKVKLQLEGLQKPADIARLKTEISELTASKKKYEALLRDSIGYPIIKYARITKLTIDTQLEKFKTFTSFIEKYFKNLQEKSVNAVNSNIELFLDDSFGQSLIRQSKASRDAIKAKEALLSSKERESTELSLHVSQLDVLSKRPTDCEIDSCPFISNALKWKDAGSKLTVVNADIEQIKKDILLLETKADNITELITLYTNFTDALNSVGARDNSVYAHFCEEKSLVDWVKGSLAEFQAARTQLENDIINAKDWETEYQAVCLSLSNKTAELERSTNDTGALATNYKQEIEEYSAKKDAVTEDYNKLYAYGEELSKKLAEKQTLLDKYNTYLNACSKFDSATVMLSSINAEINNYAKLADEISSYRIQYNLVCDAIKTVQSRKLMKTDEYNKSLAMLSQVNNLTKKLSTLKTVYKPTDTIAKALSPTSGIPLILIQMYLAETEEITNELLNVAYNGDFKIKFLTTDKDFKIQVETKNHEIKDDILLASQGEVALTTISISLTLIEQSLGEYNILCLDEIDGPLDSSNRENFINILNSQIEKLGIEQVFVISHNNAFDAYPIDLVLLKNSDIDTSNSAYMENKTVIYNYKE